jgi:hypothetical protein
MVAVCTTAKTKMSSSRTEARRRNERMGELVVGGIKARLRCERAGRVLDGNRALALPFVVKG